jgi:nicotinamidase-related amidase
MAERVWDRYLTEQDRAAMEPAMPKGAGTRPVLILVDYIRWVYGDRPEPLLAAITRWPGSCGLAAWAALPPTQRLLAAARGRGIPVVHTTQSEDIPSWRDKNLAPPPSDPEMAERRRHRYDIIDELAPIAGEAVFRKTAPSAFNQTPLLHHLRGLDADTVIVCGESTSGCVRATVVDAKSYRYKVLVPEECVFDRHEAPHAINLFDMEQKYADVLPLDEVLAYIEALASARRGDALASA